MLYARTLWDLLERRAEDTPDALATVDEDMETLTFVELWTEAERAAAGLAGAGVGPGDVVAWQLPVWPETLVLMAALARLGVVQHPVPMDADVDRVAESTAAAGATLLVCPTEWQGVERERLATEVAQRSGVLRVLYADRTLPQGDPTRLEAVPRTDPDDMAEHDPRWILDAGRPGSARCVAHSDAALIAAAGALCTRLALIPRDRHALITPLAGADAPLWLLASLLSGCANILVEHFDPQGTSEVLGREGVTLAGWTDEHHGAYLAHQRRSLQPVFPDLRAVLVRIEPDEGNAAALTDLTDLTDLTGPDSAADLAGHVGEVAPGAPDGQPPGSGAAGPIDLARAAGELIGVPVLSVYGCVEAPVLCCSDVADPAAPHGAVGRPCTGVELRVVDPDGRPVASGDDGEILARGPQLTLGHLDPVHRAEALDADGFLRTGHLGRLDEHGSLTVMGRLPDVVLRLEAHLAARELESLLLTHPGVADAAVVELPDAELGERTCAVVQPADGHDGRGLDAGSLLGHLRSQGLGQRQLPDRIELVPELPRSTSGSVLRQVLRDELAG